MPDVLIAREPWELKSLCEEVSEIRRIVESTGQVVSDLQMLGTVPISTFTPEPYQVLRPIPVAIRKVRVRFHCDLVRREREFARRN